MSPLPEVRFAENPVTSGAQRGEGSIAGLGYRSGRSRRQDMDLSDSDDVAGSSVSLATSGRGEATELYFQSHANYSTVF